MKRLQTLVARIEHHWDRRIIADGMVAAVSGGPDSVALVRLLLELRSPEQHSPLVVAHLNHQLRGDESDADEVFVRTLQATLSASGASHLMLACERMDVAVHARTKSDNLESMARRLRYRWLAQVARQHQVHWVATGHTADDQAETVLHHLLRGTGWQGLRGIAPRRELEPEITLIRPLLSIRRSELLHYLEALGQDYRQDTSNDDLRYTRNRIRRELLPHLAEQYNPAIVSVLGQWAEQAQEMFAQEQETARTLLAAAEKPGAGEMLIFDRRTLQTAARSQVRCMFRLVWERENWPRGRMSFSAWDQLAGVAWGELPAIDLPGGIRACCREQVVQVGPSS